MLRFFATTTFGIKNTVQYYCLGKHNIYKYRLYILISNSLVVAGSQSVPGNVTFVVKAEVIHVIMIKHNLYKFQIITKLGTDSQPLKSCRTLHDAFSHITRREAGLIFFNTCEDEFSLGIILFIGSKMGLLYQEGQSI